MSIRAFAAHRSSSVRSKRSRALVVLMLLPLCVGACGTNTSTNSVHHSSSHSADTSSTLAAASSIAPAPLEAKADADKDNDITAPYDDKRHPDVFGFGQAASPADRQAVTALIERYYAAAAAEDGAKACSMIYVTLAEAVPEDYGTSPPGPAYMQGKTCPAILTLLFKHFHAQLAAGLPLLKVTRVRLEHRHGLAVLSFGKMPERQIAVRRERHTWKLEALLDSELP